MTANNHLQVTGFEASVQAVLSTGFEYLTSTCRTGDSGTAC